MDWENMELASTNFIYNQSESQSIITHYLESDKLWFQEQSGGRKCIPQIVYGVGNLEAGSLLLTSPLTEHLILGESVSREVLLTEIDFMNKITSFLPKKKI